MDANGEYVVDKSSRLEMHYEWAAVDASWLAIFYASLSRITLLKQFG